MPHPTVVLDAATTGGFLLVLSLAVPIAGILLAFIAGGRHVERVAFAAMALGFTNTIAILVTLRRSGGPLLYLLGAWAPPLGVALRADGLSAVMMLATAVVICAVGVFAHADYHTPAAEARAPFAFWILLLAIWAALNTVFLGGDLFTLYVALELVTFAAVPLVCLDGRAETLQAALRYLLFALLGSILYLVGTALLYGTYGTLDIVLLSQRIGAQPATLIAVALMTVGLLAKTALFPLYLWLPPAHANAPASASAVLSALVVKGSFFIVVRLWFDVMPGLPGFVASQLLAALGAAAILFAGVLALRQEGLKLLVAYSTLAQIGNLFLMFPLALGTGSAQLYSGGALTGGMVQAISHATAKAAMFMAAGLIYTALGHDRIAELGGVGRALPISVCAFALAGLALIGVPPSGAYLAKQLLLQAAAGTEQWWWAVVLQTSGIFTSGYVFLVLAHALTPADKPVTLRVRVRLIREAAALALGLCSFLLGLAPWERYLSVPSGTSSKLLVLTIVLPSLWPIVAGGVLAILLGRWGDRFADIRFAKILVTIVGPLRRTALALGRITVQVDGVLCQWPAAVFSLMILAILFGAALLGAR
jgi:formate hydrogenlyase subunit 3/multisubunit Na+/H+ antiporter MnhD subunit